MNDSIETVLMPKEGNDSLLARALDVAPSTISRWRKKPESIPWGMVRELARIQGFSVDFNRKKGGYSY